MKNAVFNIIETKRQELKTFEGSYAFKQPLLLIDQFSQRLDELLRQMNNYTKSVVNQKTQCLEACAGRLHALSPLAILGRGYSLTFQESGKLIKDIKGLKTGDAIVTKLARGAVHSKITKIEEGER